MGEGGCRGTHTLRPQVAAGQGRENDAIKKHGEKKRLQSAAMQIGARIFLFNFGIHRYARAKFAPQASGLRARQPDRADTGNCCDIHFQNHNKRKTYFSKCPYENRI